MPPFALRVIQGRLHTTDCMHLLVDILCHKDTCLLSQGGTEG